MENIYIKNNNFYKKKEKKYVIEFSIIAGSKRLKITFYSFI